MLRVAEKWSGSDVGRQRQGNEDNYFVQAPLFVLADGMGGAQAGEVASEMTIDAFRAPLPEGSLEEALIKTIQAANDEVYEKANTVAEYHGMGTTCTVAYVTEEEVVLAHVGDSRCYLLRDSDLTRLTRDHSLVGELLARGKVSEEEALVHPQRSVITRSVGPEPTVRVDAERIAGRDGDLYLLCSDGLTDMVREPDIDRIIASASSLERAGRDLIAAANAAGGRDNITVILFRLEEVDAAGAGDDAGRTTEHALAEPDTMVTSTVSAPVAVAEPSQASQASQAPPRRTAPLPADRDGPRAPEPPPKRGLRRFGASLVVTVILLVLFGSAAYVALRAVFFVGLDANRSVTIYRGLPYEGPAGIKLYTRDYTSGVRVDQVPAARRETFTGHKLRSHDDAADLVRQLETGSIQG